VTLTEHHNADDPPRPYGDALTPKMVVPDDAEERLEAAREKWRLLRAGQTHDQPAGDESRLRRVGLVVVLVSGGPAVMGVGFLPVVLVGDPVFSFLLVTSLAGGLWSAGAIYFSMLRRRPRTDPVKALRSYFASLLYGDAKHAAKHVTNADKNDLPRFQPMHTGLGAPSGKQFKFKYPGDFKLYWAELVPGIPFAATTHRLVVREEKELAPQLRAVRFHWTVTTRNQYWLLLTPLLFSGLVLFLVLRQRYEGEMQKLMVKVGDEWKLFNGEWQGYEELDLSWLDDDDDARLPDDVRTQAP